MTLRTHNWKKYLVRMVWVIGILQVINPAFSSLRHTPSKGEKVFLNLQVIAVAEDARAIAAFNAVVDVFAHPRCKNCHAAGEGPTQGDEGRPHDMKVVRGATGRGAGGARCNNCHQLTNGVGEKAAPGSPDWRMPPPETPMIFANKTPKEICNQIKDPAQNGNKTLEDLIRHVKEDPRIQWSWNPGGKRTPAPRTLQEFIDKITEWINQGAACPD
ncbi:MAG TPA: hypothetical protein VNM22_01960 [Candidatus Limnocylindrales bacterium]|nr:hypothetical protein [Candidatus Limnocylindrales bacterium]